MIWSINKAAAQAARLTRARLKQATTLLREQGLPGAGFFSGRSAPGPRPMPRVEWQPPFTPPQAPIPSLRPKRAPKVAPGARYEARSFGHGSSARPYKLYVPRSYHNAPVPLVVMLHGCTQSADDFALGTRMNDLAEEQGFVVAYPEQITTANAQLCWNWFKADEQERGRGEPAAVAGLVAAIAAELSIDKSRIYAAGLSAGGAFVATLGAAYPDLFAAIGVHSGLPCGSAHDVPTAFAAMRDGPRLAASPRARSSAPAIVFHGDRDRTVNPANGEAIVSQATGQAEVATKVVKGRSAGGIAFTRRVESDATGRPLAEHWTLHGAGHAWSGGSEEGSFTEPRGPDASREMLRFFRGHSLR